MDSDTPVISSPPLDLALVLDAMAAQAALPDAKGRVRGEQRWLEMTVTPLGHGGPLGALVLVTDITERKQAREKMAKQEIRSLKAQLRA